MGIVHFPWHSVAQTFNWFTIKKISCVCWSDLYAGEDDWNKERRWRGSTERDSDGQRERERAVSALRKRKLGWLIELLKPEILVWLLLLVTTATVGGGQWGSGEGGGGGTCRSTSVALWVSESLQREVTSDRNQLILIHTCTWNTYNKYCWHSFNQWYHHYYFALRVGRQLSLLLTHNSLPPQEQLSLSTGK